MYIIVKVWPSETNLEKIFYVRSPYPNNDTLMGLGLDMYLPVSSIT